MKPRTTILLIVLATLSAATSATQGQAPAYIPFQGYLTDAADKPIEGEVAIRFRFYDTPEPSGDAKEILHEESQNITVEEGYFTTYLGDKNAIDLDLFRANSIVFVGLKVGDDADEVRPLIQLGTAPYAAFASACDTASTLQGYSADDLMVSAMCEPGQVIRGITGSAVMCDDVPAGPAGPAGPIGPRGLQGPPGPPAKWYIWSTTIADAAVPTTSTYLDTPLTPNLTGGCSITAEVSVMGGSGSYVWVQPALDGRSIGDGMRASINGSVSATSTADISAGKSYRFGCRIENTNVTGATIRCRITIVCLGS